VEHERAAFHSQHCPFPQSDYRRFVLLQERPDAFLARLTHVGEARMGINIGRVDLKGTSPSASSEARSIQATDPQQFASIPLYEVARVFKAQRDHRSREDEEPTEAQKAVLRSKRIHRVRIISCSGRYEGSSLEISGLRCKLDHSRW
jgi:hypothetical protein